MLKQRIITAVIMAFVFLSLLFFTSAVFFYAAIACVFGVGAWEWGRLSGLSSQFTRVAYSAFIVSFGAVLAQLSDWAQSPLLTLWVLGAGALWWGIAFILIKSYPANSAVFQSTLLRLFLGGFVLLPAWVGALFLRAQNEGALVVLLCVVIVACADIGAYFSGRRFGRRKLAVTVSPGKSWEGVWGGVVVAGCVGSLIMHYLGSSPFWLPIVVILPVALFSVVGDLLESLIKRVAGMKDSGRILPGHGGVLDRIDGMLAAIPVFALLILLFDWTL